MVCETEFLIKVCLYSEGRMTRKPTFRHAFRLLQTQTDTDRLIHSTGSNENKMEWSGGSSDIGSGIEKESIKTVGMAGSAGTAGAVGSIKKVGSVGTVGTVGAAFLYRHVWPRFGQPHALHLFFFFIIPV